MNRATLLFCLALSGCATIQTYDGPPLPASQVAHVRIEPLFSVMVAVDNEGFLLTRKSVDVMPGEHVFKVRHSDWKTSELTYADVRLMCEAGKTYVISTELRQERLHVTVRLANEEIGAPALAR